MLTKKILQEAMKAAGDSEDGEEYVERVLDILYRRLGIIDEPREIIKKMIAAENQNVG